MGERQVGQNRDILAERCEVRGSQWSLRHGLSRLPSCQPVAELSQRIRALNQQRVAEGLPRILVHTDAAQMVGKGRVDVQELGVDYLTIVGHKVWPCSHGPGAIRPLRHLCWGARETLGAPPQLFVSSSGQFFPL